LALVRAASQAQLVNDGATATLSNVTNAAPSVSVGTNGSFTLLVLADNALLDNSDNGVIGVNATAKSNEVRVLSPTARWLMGGDLYVGNEGSASRLVVSNGAFAQNRNCYLGRNESSSNNVAVVTGSGSVWSNDSGLYLGFNGAGNQLLVSNGGVLSGQSGDVGFNDSSSNNVAVVTGAGSAWSNTYALSFGYNGAGNQLAVSNAGLLQSAFGFVGGGGVSGSNNTVSVAGAGSIWINTGELRIGNGAEGNQLLVSGGGAVRSGQGALGGNVFGSNNLALITGPGSVWSNALGITIGSFSSQNRMVVSNGAAVYAGTDSVIGPTAEGNFNSATVTGPGTRWRMGEDLYVGSNGAFGLLVVSEGASVENANASVGFSASSSNNTVVVTGAGSTWSNGAVLNLGETGGGNRLVVSNGGRVQCDFAEIGRNAPSGNNEAVVTGQGSTWRVAGGFLVGDSGGGNRLMVSNSASLRDNDAYVGFLGGNNTAVVTGPGSSWTNTQDFYLGFFGSSNYLLLSDGAMVANSNAVLGLGAASTQNTALVSGPGSLWTNAGDFFIGQAGSGNRLQLEKGAAVYVRGDGGIGINTGARSNSVSVMDPGTKWQIATHLYVGSNGPFNRLLITNQASVFAAHLVYIGYKDGANSNAVTVTGAGSAWTNLDYFFIGQGGAGNQLIVSNGASVRAGGAFTGIGLDPDASNNTALVTGPGSYWQIDGLLDLSRYGDNNRLTVADGGAAWIGASRIGYSSSGNQLLVTGPNSTCTFGQNLIVGYVGTGNRLVVSNGAVALGLKGIIVGELAGSSANQVLVDGATLGITNAAGTAILDVRRGATVLNTGLIAVDNLLLTNAAGLFEFNGGTMAAGSSRVGNGTIFRIGNGIKTAAMILTGNGVHDFTGMGVQVRANATLAGSGTIIGPLTLSNGAKLSPGTSIGNMIFGSAPVLQGETIMEIGRNVSVLTNDHMQVILPLTYGGALTVSNLGPTTLVAGDTFRLFTAPSYVGAFTNLSLPPLPSGFVWTNKLLVDGSIQVIGPPSPPRIESVVRSGTNVIISGTGGTANSSYRVLASTNVALPLPNWIPILTNQFNGSGAFSFTNAMSPVVPRRFYILQLP